MAKVKIDEKEVKNASSSSIAYRGKVTIKLVKGNKVLKTVRTHNAGGSALFDFLTQCLAEKQNWNNCPHYLKCFYLDDGDPTESNLGNNVFIGGNSLACVSADQVKDTSGENPVFKTVYKFIIPSSLINVDAYSTINVLALYNYNNVISGKPSAYLKLSDDDAISTSGLGAGINILILWELSFDNAVNSEE